MSRTRSPGSTSIRVRAATRSIAAMSRIGVPVTKHGRFGAAPASVRQVASNETASAAASRAVARTARPGMTLPSHITTGMPSGAAAISTGTAT